MPISEKFRQEEQRPSDIEALLQLFTDENKLKTTEINYPYEIMALQKLAPILKEFDLDSGNLLEDAVNTFLDDMIPFKRKRVNELLEGLKHIKQGNAVSPDDIINNQNRSKAI